MSRRADQPSLTLPMREGVHLHLPRDRYDEARAIGADDLKVLYWQPQSWWFQSDYNARRRVKLKSARRAALDLRDALRSLVLGGEGAYRDRFAFQPDEDSPHWIKTPVDLKKALADMGVDVRGVWGEKLFALARKKGIANRVWDIAWSAFESSRRIKPHLSEADDMRVRDTAALIDQHDDLGPAMRGGLSEVSVFWRREDDPDTLLRARFDKLRVKRIYSLELIGNWRGRDIDAAIGDAIDQADHGVERRLAAEAFDAFCRFVNDGKIFVYADDGQPAFLLGEARALLKQIADAGAAEWFWIFVQLRNDAFGHERAPAIVPRFHLPAGRIWNDAGLKIEAALDAYRKLRGEFSLERPWALVDDVKELVDADVRSRLKKETG
jgi:hypothetical protein